MPAPDPARLVVFADPSRQPLANTGQQVFAIEVDTGRRLEGIVPESPNHSLYIEPGSIWRRHESLPHHAVFGRVRHSLSMSLPLERLLLHMTKLILAVVVGLGFGIGQILRPR